MTVRSIKVAVIGLGVGEQHVISYQRIPDCEVVAVCDIDPVKLEEVATRHGISRKHSDYRRIADDPDINVVSICSYDDAHVEQALAALRNGKHIFVEKPIALNKHDAEALLRALEDSGRKISSNLILRQSPRFIELKRLIDAGELGDITYMEGDYIHDILWKLSEGWRGKMDFYCVAFGGGIHLIDLMRWFIGREVVEVAGMGSDCLTRDTHYKYPDTMVNILRFDNGVLGKTTSHFSPQRTKFHALNVYGTKKTFINDMPNAKLFDGVEPENEHPMTALYPAVEKGDLLADFIDAVRNDRDPIVSKRDVFRLMDICFAAWESVRQGRNVKVDYLL